MSVNKSDLDTRELLIMTALRLFARNGIEGVSLRQITQDTRASRSFKSK